MHAKILLDTYRDQAEQWCWRTSWRGHGESALTLFWKFAHLNQLTARELAAVITNRTSGRRTAICARPDVDLRDASAFDMDRLSAMFRAPQARVREAFLYELLPGSVLRSHDHLRWCTSCLCQGFHSPLFQMRLTRTCPIHDEPLRDTCPSCRQRIPYRLNDPLVLNPFRCPHCDFDFFPSMSVDRPKMLRLRRHDITNLSRLLKYYRSADADQVHANEVDHLIVSARKAGIFHVDVDEAGVQCRYASFIAQVVHEAAPGVYQKRDGMRFETMTRHVCGCQRRSLSDDEDDIVERDSDDVEVSSHMSTTCLAAIIDTYKTVRRQLWRTVLRKHQRCVRSAAQRMGSPMGGERTGGFCTFALAFIRWRMLWEGCGTPKYLLARPDRDYFGIIAWYLARPCPVPDHWSTPTKAWLTSHIFGTTCQSAFEEMMRSAEFSRPSDAVDWKPIRSPIEYSCLWAIAGRDCPDRPATIYLRRTFRSCNGNDHIEDMSAHWRRHLADIDRLLSPARRC